MSRRSGTGCWFLVGSDDRQVPTPAATEGGLLGRPASGSASHTSPVAGSPTVWRTHHFPGPSDLDAWTSPPRGAPRPSGRDTRWHRVVHAPPLDLGDGHVHPPGLHIGGVEPPRASGASIGASMANRSAGISPMPRWSRPWMRSSIQRAARSLSSARLFGAPVAAHSSKNRSFTSRKGRSTLPFRLASLAWQARISVPWNWANVGGRRMQREPPALGLAEGPHPVGAAGPWAPRRRARRTGPGPRRCTPGRWSGRTTRSAPGTTTRSPEKHWTSPSPHSLVQWRHVGPVELALLARCGHDPGRAAGAAVNRGPRRSYRCRATVA